LTPQSGILDGAFYNTHHKRDRVRWVLRIEPKDLCELRLIACPPLDLFVVLLLFTIEKTL
jgi:hypothetical protein